MTSDESVIASQWQSLRRYTDARVALGRAGHSLPTVAHLDFQLAHAQARDAVHLPLDACGIASTLQVLGLATLVLHSAAPDRASYLQNPDLGRQLDARSRQTLADWQQNRVAAQQNEPFDLAFVVADGLSALAIHQNAIGLLSATLGRVRADEPLAWTVAPIVIVEQGRVAIGDEIGAALQAKTVVVLIGERPGLSAPDSLGVYLTWNPKIGLNDASRNCISNIRPAGLAIDAGAARLHHLLTQARLRQLSGVGLKDESDQGALASKLTATDSFLLAADSANAV
jgi:ethanolamine ammonia-lyase small subunit